MSAPAKSKPRVAAKPSHPPYKAMVMQVLEANRGKKTSRIGIVQGIRASGASVDPTKMNNLVSRTLVKLVAGGQVIQVSGHGASGSFRLPPKASMPKPVKAVKKPKAKKPKAKKAAAKKPKAAKSPAKTKTTTKKTAAAKKTTTKKATTTKKSPAKKPAAKRPAAKKPAAKKPAAKKPAAKKPAAKKAPAKK